MHLENMVPMHMITLYSETDWFHSPIRDISDISLIKYIDIVNYFCLNFLTLRYKGCIHLNLMLLANNVIDFEFCLVYKISVQSFRCLLVTLYQMDQRIWTVVYVRVTR